MFLWGEHPSPGSVVMLTFCFVFLLLSLLSQGSLIASMALGIIILKKR